jgi:tetratricopeptide (TPR) repeat protein
MICENEKSQKGRRPLIKNRINSIEEEEKPRSSGHSGKKVILITAAIALLAVTAVLIMLAIYHEKPGNFLSGLNMNKETAELPKKAPLDSALQKPLPESKNEHIRLGKESYLKKYYRDASAEFNEVLESDAGDSDKAIALTYLGMISTDTGDYAQAVEYFRRALLYDRDNPEILKHLALALRYKKDYNEAISQVKLSLEKSPRDVDALILLGNIYFEMARYSDAADQYRKALEAEPENATVLYNLATALLKTGDDFAATEYLKKAASLDRLGEVAHRSLSMLGILFIEKGDYGQAEDYLKKALALRPSSAVDHYNLGIVYLRLSKNDEALQEFSQAEEHSASEEKMLENLGSMYSRLNQYDKSISVYEKLLMGNNRNIRILSRMGEIYYKKGELDKAYDIYKKITLIEPASENARNAYLNMGNILDDANDSMKLLSPIKKPSA